MAAKRPNLTCSVAGVDISKSTYQLRNSRKPMSYDEALLGLLLLRQSNLTQYGSDPAVRKVVDEEFTVAFTRGQSLEKEGKDATDEELSDLIFRFGPPSRKVIAVKIADRMREYVAKCQDNQGNIAYLVRKPIAGNCWQMVADATTLHATIRNGSHGTTPIIDRMSTEYYRSKYNGGVLHMEFLDEADGKWSKPIDKLRAVEWIVRKFDLIDKGIITADQYASVLEFEKTYGTSDAPNFHDVFLNVEGGWLWSMWDKDPRCFSKQPKSLTNDPTVPAYNYLDLGSLSNGPTPYYDGYLKQFPDSCVGPYLAALGVAITEDAHISQVVWKHSKGGDGKSEEQAALCSYVGQGFAVGLSSSNFTSSSEFGLETAIGASLMLIGDEQGGALLKTDKLHQITGGDNISINRKNQKHMQVRFDCVVMVNSNYPPEINLGHRNELRRLFYIPFRDPPKEVLASYCEVDAEGNPLKYEAVDMYRTKGFALKDALLKEMPHILWKARNAMAEYYGVRMLKLPEKVMALLATMCGSDEADVFNAFYTSHIEAADGTDTLCHEVTNAFLVYAHGANAINAPKPYSMELRSLNRMLENKGHKRRQRRTDGSRIYHGLKLKAISAIAYSSRKLVNPETAGEYQ